MTAKYSNSMQRVDLSASYDITWCKANRLPQLKGAPRGRGACTRWKLLHTPSGPHASVTSLHCSISWCTPTTLACPEHQGDL